MKITEKRENLFNYNCPIAHCISADYAMGAGIAVEVSRRYKLRTSIHNVGNGTYPDCIFLNNVFNLVTKNKYWHKPTYDSLEASLRLMKQIILEKGIKEVAMPKIGCGLDRLQWGKVREIINEVFDDTDIIINVCHL